MTKEKLSHNDQVWAKIAKLNSDIEELKKTLEPATLPKQADLNTCNAIARKAKTKPTTVNPSKLSQESGIKVKN